jgi:hypothetical protein
MAVKFLLTKGLGFLPNSVRYLLTKGLYTIGVIKNLTLAGSVGTALALTGSKGTALSLTGTKGTAISLTGTKNVATQANIEFYKGEDVVLTVSMSPTTNISGWTLAFTLKKLYTDNTPVFTKTTGGGGITITDSVNGVFTITIASADTSGLDLRAYAFDIQRTNAGNRTVLTIGNLTLLPEVNL